MNSKYRFLIEQLDNRRFIKNRTILHGSPTQGLDKLKPWSLERGRPEPYKPIYASEDPAYASAFTFRHEDKVQLMKTPDGGWLIKIPNSMKEKLKDQFCSIYTSDLKYFNPINHGRTPDYVSPFADIPVMQEDQFKSPLDAFKKYGLQVEWIE